MNIPPKAVGILMFACVFSIVLSVGSPMTRWGEVFPDELSMNHRVEQWRDATDAWAARSKLQDIQYKVLCVQQQRGRT
jgi:hypothetical protein